MHAMTWDAWPGAMGPTHAMHARPFVCALPLMHALICVLCLSRMSGRAQAWGHAHALIHAMHVQSALQCQAAMHGRRAISLNVHAMHPCGLPPQGQAAMSWKFVADVPTITMSRLKALLTVSGWAVGW
jgi:hypothetical protein